MAAGDRSTAAAVVASPASKARTSSSGVGAVTRRGSGGGVGDGVGRSLRRTSAARLRFGAAGERNVGAAGLSGVGGASAVMAASSVCVAGEARGSCTSREQSMAYGMKMGSLGTSEAAGSAAEVVSAADRRAGSAAWWQAWEEATRNDGMVVGLRSATR